MLFVKNYFLKPDKSARDKDASGMNRCKSSCTKIYCLVQTLPTKCACHGLCHHPVSMILLASMTHQQVSHQHLDLTGGLKRSRAHIFRHGLEQTISMVQNKRHLKSPTRDGKIHTSIRQVQHQRSQQPQRETGNCCSIVLVSQQEIPELLMIIFMDSKPKLPIIISQLRL